MTQSEPHIPGTLFATTLVVVSFVMLLTIVVVSLWGLHRLMAWLLG